ncbi:Ubiquitin-like modifier-activating enzyme ATG7 [Eumeta japonica]|uniref:Ubiquitin-like modifier-activating enzyme ATG7 n=1 Tax=Eumeta variegata TaxID=151549 RepID=A0A4C1T0D0_EUMVA|nr:Ubiquitin-like modifier-activating enzyme ATG7 [Eumeta japonica]
MKLDVDKLDENSKQIFGKFTYRDDVGPVFEVEGSSFNKTQQYSPYYVNVTGTIMNKNTIEDFKNIDKSSLINSVAPSQPLVYVNQKGIPLKNHFNQKQLDKLTEGYKDMEKNLQDFFGIIVEKDSVNIIKISDILRSDVAEQSKFDYDLTKIYFGFTDSSNGLNPGWPLRIFLAALLEHCPCLAGSNIHILSLRTKVNGDISSSTYFEIRIPQDVNTVESAGWVGWERNDRGNFGPKLANMSSSMDPVKLADASSDLNIKLMKWRLVPDLNLDIIKDTKCLLFGAGTLGCHVARNLIVTTAYGHSTLQRRHQYIAGFMGRNMISNVKNGLMERGGSDAAWGFRYITFLDSGKVSYSNPTRQVLFNHIDCHKGGKRKAEAAAENLKQILPSVNTQSLVAHIPMPGHPVGHSIKDETIDNIEKITKAIEDHDVLFLLLDSREARWMPSLIAAHLGKSLKDRTLDQQCTVTRPGVAAIAGALAVEMLVGLLQHPLKLNAPAACNLSEEIDKGTKSESEGILGVVPHSIRGFLWSYQTVVPTTIKFKQCIACSDDVINKYKADSIDFLLKVFNDANYLEEITGLSELHLAAEMSDVLMLSDDENE